MIGVEHDTLAALDSTIDDEGADIVNEGVDGVAPVGLAF